MNLITQKELLDSCHDLHINVEHTVVSQGLINGDIEPLLYKNVCYQLYLIADAIENRYYFSHSDLVRRHLLVNDIANSINGPVTACNATVKYIEHLNRLNHLFLKGHIYTHYLGWLYGGQLIAKNLNLPVAHLKFKNVTESVNFIRRSVLSVITDLDVVEARVAFQSIIDIYNELAENNF